MGATYLMLKLVEMSDMATGLLGIMELARLFELLLFRSDELRVLVLSVIWMMVSRKDKDGLVRNGILTCFG